MSNCPTHGLVYPDNFINDLKSLPGHSNSSIKLISSAQFSELHLRHVLAHPPDNVLFPFLHGLEGKNQDQYTFFVSGNNSVVRPPLFRGLVWVACEDDLDETTRRHLARQQQEVSIDSAGSEEYDDDDELDDDDDEESFPRVSPPPTSSDDDQNASFSMDLDDPIDALRDSQESHMHPVAHKHAINAFSNSEAPSKQPPDAIQTSNFHLHDRRDSSASGFSESTSASGSLFSSPTDSVLSTVPFSDPTPPTEHTPETQQERIDNPPLLTCTFRECDLLRHVEEELGVWEFAPVHVPSGISLRNFGIQVVSKLVYLC
jgi:dual specificity MAP kinase phosphatase